jgi:hypothetical protein
MRYELEEGEHPGNGPGFASLATLVTAFFGACCFIVIKRNVVFQPAGHFATPLANGPRNQGIAVWATGRYVFDAKTAKYFVHVPAILAIDSGRPVLRSKIDTSSRFMGVSTRNQVGIWQIPVMPGSVQDGRFGFMYFGFSRRYAFRFSYEEAPGGRRRKAVVAADTAEDAVRTATMVTGGAATTYA